jgi:hypothetical protein
MVRKGLRDSQEFINVIAGRGTIREGVWIYWGRRAVYQPYTWT